MADPCSQTENIADIKESLKTLMNEFRIDFRSMMGDIRAALEDSREFRTQIGQLQRDITRLETALDEAKIACERNRDAIAEHAEKTGTRIGLLETWKASIVGERVILKYIPTIISLGLAAYVAFR